MKLSLTPENILKELKEPLVSFTVAKLLKAEGFNIPVENYYNNLKDIGDVYKNTTYYDNGDGIDQFAEKLRVDFNSTTASALMDYTTHSLTWNSQNELDILSAPTQSLVERVLRKYYNIHIAVTIGYGIWEANLYNHTDGQFIDTVSTPKGIFIFNNREECINSSIIFTIINYIKR